MRCPSCNSENVNDAVFCANCGAVISAEDGFTPPQAPEYSPPGYQVPFNYSSPDTNDQKAVAGLVLGISSLPCCFISMFTPASFGLVAFIVCAVIGILGIVMSAKGLRSKKKRGAAIAGLVCAIVGLILIIITICLLAFGLYAIENNLYDGYLYKSILMLVK